MATESYSVSTTGTAHYGLVANVEVGVLQNLIRRCDGLESIAPGLVQVSLIDNGKPNDAVGCRRRVVLGPGVPPNRFQSENVLADALLGRGPYGTAGGRSEAAAGPRFCGRLLVETLVDASDAPQMSTRTFDLMTDPVALGSSESPFAGIGMQSMRTVVSASAVSGDANKSYLSFFTTYEFTTTVTAEGHIHPVTGGYRAASEVALSAAAAEKVIVEDFLNRHWLRPLALSYHEYALNAAYPVLGVDGPNAPADDAIAKAHAEAMRSLQELLKEPYSSAEMGKGLRPVGGAEQFRVDLQMRAEYEGYEKQLMEFHGAMHPTDAALSQESVTASYEKLLSSWTLLAVELRRREQIVACLRHELFASRHITSTAAGTMVANASRVEESYRGDTTNSQSPTGGHESSGQPPVAAAPAAVEEQAAAPAPEVVPQNEPTSTEEVSIPMPPVAVPPPAAPDVIDPHVLRRAVMGGSVLSNEAVERVFEGLDSEGRGYLTKDDLAQVWAAFDDFGQYDNGTGRWDHINQLKATQEREAAMPIKDIPAPPKNAEEPQQAVAAPDRILGNTGSPVGESATRRNQHFMKLVDGWVVKNLRHRYGPGTPRRQREAEVRISKEEFGLFMLQMARR